MHMYDNERGGTGGKGRGLLSRRRRSRYVRGVQVGESTSRLLMVVTGQSDPLRVTNVA